MSKTPFLIIVASALLALHLQNTHRAEQGRGGDSRLVWTTRQGGKLEASLEIRGHNSARIVIWRSSGRSDGGFEAERKIFDESFTDATTRPRANSVMILEQAADAAANRYRFEVFTSRAAATDWRSLNGPALMDYPAEESRGVILNFEDTLDSSGPGADFRDIILSLRES